MKTDKKLTAKDYQRALDVQDACNLSGIVHSFAAVLPLIMEEVKSTEGVWRHPISVMYVSKIDSLVHGSDMNTFGVAYEACKDKAKAKAKANV